MSNDQDDTVSFALMGQLLTELEDRCDSDSGFSLFELLDSFSLSSENRDLLQELVVHHFRILQERTPDLLPEIYFSSYPEHQQYVGAPEELLNPSRISAALLRASDSGSRFPASSKSFPASAAIPEFRGGPLGLLPVSMQKALHSQMQPAVFHDGQKIITEGEEGDLLYVCCAGSAKVTIVQDHAKKLRIGRIVPGQVFGEMALMGIPWRTATVTAEGVVDVLTLSKQDFHSLLRQHQEFSNVITTIIGERLGNHRRDALFSVTLEGYQISRRLGRGGMAVVYDALSEETGQRVALKMMSHRLHIDQLAREWFDREAQLISSFDHPNIPRLLKRFDAFATAFMVIEFIEGASLAQVLKERGPYDETSVLRILANLVHALEYAHSAGIVHRDVKPANCMIDLKGDVKLMDFGLSVPFFAGKDSRCVIAGTPAYMSPEQFRGEICPESDWFSLGCVAFELMTGQRLSNPTNLLAMGQNFQKWNVGVVLSQIPKSYSTAKKILRSLLDIEPGNRSKSLGMLEEFRKPLNVSDWDIGSMLGKK
ncbi:protein kinase domain-containing protein [Thalassoglobus sp.]|uniref:protein kinase domain-containing protein n=1 Tax=Thalassoglobus sp. TaxID=2795869 RepID=UPI003AA89E79